MSYCSVLNRGFVGDLEIPVGQWVIPFGSCRLPSFLLIYECVCQRLRGMGAAARDGGGGGGGGRTGQG